MNEQLSGSSAAGPASDRVRLRRKRERASYEREVIDAILDEALLAHIAFVEQGGQPLVIPTLHTRCGDVVYCHGSAASRTLRALAPGAPLCLTVSLLDGLVLARAAMHHSANYRSVVLMGKARVVDDHEEKLMALRATVEHILPGRWGHVRAPTDNELRATAVIAIPIVEASAKIRTGPPQDDEADYALETWAGVIPLTLRSGASVADSRLVDGIEPPGYVNRYRRPGTT